MHRSSSIRDVKDSRGFTLVELLVVIGIMAVLMSLLLPGLGKAKRRARMIEEMSAVRQLLISAHIYSDDYRGMVFPGYVTDATLVDNTGRMLQFPINARYPWRIAPYLGNSFETIYCAENRARLSRFRQSDQASYAYAVSVYPSLGINSYFIGGNETEFPAAAANVKFGPGTVVTAVSQINNPSLLAHFISARSATTGADANGYYQVTPPQIAGRVWAPRWSSGLQVEQWGFVAPRFDGRAVAGMMDGHARTLNVTQVQDMRRWCNTADAPDFTLKQIKP